MDLCNPARGVTLGMVWERKALQVILSAAHRVCLHSVTHRLQLQELLQQFALNSRVQGVNKYKQPGLVVFQGGQRSCAEFGSLKHSGDCAWLVWGSQSSHLGQRVVH